MRFPSKTIALSALLITFAAAQPAKADIFVWQDAHTKLKLSYPDSWAQIHNQQPDDIFTAQAPGDNQYVTCRMRAREDARFVVYPRKYADEIQRVNYSREFWEVYTGEFGGAEINGVWDNAGLGDGFASFADISFIAPSGMQKRGLMFASVYNNKAFIAECSSEAGVYGDWYQDFLSFVKSVDFRDEYHRNYHGWYRDFIQEDPVLRIRGKKDIDLYTY